MLDNDADDIGSHIEEPPLFGRPVDIFLSGQLSHEQSDPVFGSQGGLSGNLHQEAILHGDTRTEEGACCNLFRKTGG